MVGRTIVKKRQSRRALVQEMHDDLTNEGGVDARQEDTFHEDPIKNHVRNEDSQKVKEHMEETLPNGHISSPHRTDELRWIESYLEQFQIEVISEFATMKSEFTIVRLEFADVKQNLSITMACLKELTKVRYFPLYLSYLIVCIKILFAKIFFTHMLQDKYVESPQFSGSQDGDEDGEGDDGSDDMTSDADNFSSDHVNWQHVYAW